MLHSLHKDRDYTWSAQRPDPVVGHPRTASFPPRLTRKAGVAMVISAMFASQVAVADVVDAAHPAPTQWSDTIHPFVSTTYTHDDNLLRQDEGANDGSDNYTTVQAGFLFDRPVGRQTFSGWVKASKVAFERNDQYNYTGKDGKIDWDWVLGDHLHGLIGTNYVQTLTSFSDFSLTERNLTTEKRSYADGTWQFHPSWQVHGGFMRDVTTYSLPETQGDNRTEDTTNAGVDYLATSASRIGLLVRHIKGTYPQQIGTDGNYTQDELDLNVNWTFSAQTQVIFVGGHVRRKQSRDSDGNNGRLIGIWTPTGKLRFTGMVWREFAAAQTLVINSALSKGESIDANWDITPKVGLNGNFKHEKRDFNAITGLFVPLGTSDSTNTGAVSLTYKPIPSIALAVTGSHESRSGNAFVGTTSYKSNAISFSASAQF